MSVEELLASDGPAAVALWEACGLTRPWNDPLDDFDRAHSGATSSVLGVREGDDLAACVMVGYDGHRGWIYYLAVDERYRLSGLGATLVRAAEGWLRDVGATKAQLMVRQTNQGVRGFYEKLGYEDADTVVLARWITELESQP